MKDLGQQENWVSTSSGQPSTSPNPVVDFDAKVAPLVWRRSRRRRMCLSGNEMPIPELDMQLRREHRINVAGASMPA